MTHEYADNMLIIFNKIIYSKIRLVIDIDSKN